MVIGDRDVRQRFGELQAARNILERCKVPSARSESALTRFAVSAVRHRFVAAKPVRDSDYGENLALVLENLARLVNSTEDEFFILLA